MLHVVGNEYVIVGVPAPTPVTTPVVEPIVAREGLLLTQVPPPMSVNVTVEPTQTSMVPEIADGIGLTVTDELPIMLLVQKVVASVATAVYTPAVVCKPKLIAEPVPETGVPTSVAPLYN